MQLNLTQPIAAHLIFLLQTRFSNLSHPQKMAPPSAFLLKIKTLRFMISHQVLLQVLQIFLYFSLFALSWPGLITFPFVFSNGLLTSLSAASQAFHVNSYLPRSSVLYLNVTPLLKIFQCLPIVKLNSKLFTLVHKTTQGSASVKVVSLIPITTFLSTISSHSDLSLTFSGSFLSLDLCPGFFPSGNRFSLIIHWLTPLYHFKCPLQMSPLERLSNHSFWSSPITSSL